MNGAEQQELHPSYQNYNTLDLVDMPSDANLGFFDNQVAGSTTEPQPDGPEILRCTQCFYTSKTREEMEQHVSISDVTPRVLFSCPACQGYKTCLAEDLVTVGGHLDECYEAHKVGWLVGNRHFQHPETLQHLQHAMHEAVPRPEGFEGQALLYSTPNNFAETLGEEVDDHGAAGSLYTEADPQMPTHGWAAEDQPVFQHEWQTPGSDEYFANGVPDDQQLFWNPSEPQAQGAPTRQLAQHTEGIPSEYDFGVAMPPQNAEKNGEVYYREEVYANHIGHFPDRESVTSPTGASHPQNGMGNAESASSHAATAVDSRTKSAMTPALLQQISTPATQSPYLAYLDSNGTDAIDDFIRTRGDSEPADTGEPVSHDSDEEREEETLANKTAWQPRTAQPAGAMQTTIARQNSATPVTVKFDSQTPASKPVAKGHTKQDDRPVPQPLAGRNKVAATKRPKPKAPSIMQGMKAARAAKKAQDASQEAPVQTESQKTQAQQASFERPFPQQADVEPITSSEAISRPGASVPTTSHQPTAQQTMPPATTAMTPQPVANSKTRSRAGENEPSALGELKRRRLDDQSRSKAPQTATRKVTVVAGPKPRVIVAPAQMAPSSNSSSMVGDAGQKQVDETDHPPAAFSISSDDLPPNAPRAPTARQEMPDGDATDTQAETGQGTEDTDSVKVAVEGKTRLRSGIVDDEKDHTDDTSGVEPASGENRVVGGEPSSTVDPRAVPASIHADSVSPGTGEESFMEALPNVRRVVKEAGRVSS